MSKQTAAVSDSVKINRSEAIRLLEDLQACAAQNKLGNGRFFSAKWVAVGDDKISPHLCHKVVRFQVTQHLKGGSLSWDPTSQGYIVVFEMMNRQKALKCFKDQAASRVRELVERISSARQDQAQKQESLNNAESESTAAESDLKLVCSRSYSTATERKRAEAPANQRKKTADRQVKLARTALDRAQKTVRELNQNADSEQLKVDNPEEAIRQSITEQIAKLHELLAAETVDSKRQTIERKLAVKEHSLKDPIKTLLVRYRMLNVKGLVELKINGKTYEVTTKPEPALPGA